jgi:hypothetical protein
MGSKRLSQNVSFFQYYGTSGCKRVTSSKLMAELNKIKVTHTKRTENENT